MYSPIPNAEQLFEGAESDGRSANVDYADDSEDGSDDSDDCKEVDSPPCTERRSKQTQDPAAGQGKANVSSARPQKRTGTPTPDPVE